jgi:hypothetical protein
LNDVILTTEDEENLETGEEKERKQRLFWLGVLAARRASLNKERTKEKESA